MSWSTYVPATPAAEFAAAIEAATVIPYGDEAQQTATLEQLAAAKAAAQVIWASGMIGGSDSGGSFGANLSGHANPGHVPTSGWANDSITVNLYRAQTPATPEPALATSGAASV